MAVQDCGFGAKYREKSGFFPRFPEVASHHVVRRGRISVEKTSNTTHRIINQLLSIDCDTEFLFGCLMN
jgi:hypothetical protein